MTVVEHVMGMPVVVDVRDEDVDAADVGRMFAWLRWVDATFSTYREDSEICRLDRGELSLIEAHKDVQWVLARCERLCEETDGYFDAHVSGRLDPSGFVKGGRSTERRSCSGTPASRTSPSAPAGTCALSAATGGSASSIRRSVTASQRCST
jgi:ApbE family